VWETRSRGEHDMHLRGVLDDDPLKQGAVVNGLRVLGWTEALPTLKPALGIDQVIITIADAPQAQLRRILSLCERIPVRTQMIPAMRAGGAGPGGGGSRRGTWRCGSGTCWGRRGRTRGG
jgi:FlaA1/EpsC-like NDP-sugar epimerase